MSFDSEKSNEHPQSDVKNFEAKSYWKGDTSEFLKTLTIGQLVENSASTFANRIAVSMYKGEKLTYAQVEEKTNTLAAAFYALGLKKGDHIAICGFNSVEWYLSFLAAAKAGLVTVNINPLYEAPELKLCLLLSDSKAIILSETTDEQVLYKLLSKVTPEIIDFDNHSHIQTMELPLLKTVVTTSTQCRKGTFTWSELFDMGEDEYRHKIDQVKNEVDIFDECDLQFTSGTTSAPKGVLLTHHNLVNNGYWIGKYLRMNEKHHKPCVLPPFFHAYGMAAGIIASIWYGATTTIPFNKYSPTKAISCVIEEKCTLIYGTPTMYIDLLSNSRKRAEQDPQIYQKLSNVERIFTGGATCLPEVIENLREHWPKLKITSGYGMTELSPVTFMSLPDDPPEFVQRTIGRILDHMETKVINQDNEIIPLGTPGELCFRGHMVMKGYYKNPEKTAEVIDSDGWFCTGDRCILMENGYAQIVGRIKDTIIRGGENIEPKDVEEVIIKHPEVEDVQVYGVTDDRLGEVVAASILKKENSTISEEDIRQYCSGVYPRTASGKIQKFKLRSTLEKELKLKSKTALSNDKTKNCDSTSEYYD